MRKLIAYPRLVSVLPQDRVIYNGFKKEVKEIGTSPVICRFAEMVANKEIKVSLVDDKVEIKVT